MLYTKLKKLTLNNVTQENLKSMEGFLFGDEELSELDISCLDTSEVVSMKGMYTNCHKLQSINVSWMKTGNVTDQVKR